MLAYTFTDKLIVLGSNDRPEDKDNNLNNTHAPIALDSEKLSNDALDLDILPSPFSRSANRVKDSDSDNSNNNINNNISSRSVKRQRSSSSCCEPNLHYTSTLPLLHHKDRESSTANACRTSSDESRGDRILLRQWKLQIP